jgi:hypothetical protein
MQSHVQAIKLDHVSDCRRMTMPTGYVLGDIVTKAAYFSLAAAAFIFVAMTLLPGLHP